MINIPFITKIIMTQHKTRGGFTLVELLVVIFVIAIISTLSYVVLEGTRAKGRDARRLADIYMIRQALELYKDREGSYPINLPEPQQSLLGPSGRLYLSPMPSDPKTSQPYLYNLLENGGYRLIFNLERDNQGYSAGENVIISPGDDK